MKTRVRHPLVSGHPPAWARAWGQDRHGIFAAFRVEGVEHRLRWIPPGEFTIGSPADEVGRYDDEVQRRVVFAEGFWLGETTVTQELWEKVTGANPSHFPGPKRPVENVSWEDAVSFIDRVNERIDGLNLRLPSDEEWEYACRAGTTTPFSFGDTITTEQVNYDGNYPYGRGEKGEYREATVDVGMMPPNDWGLREMHGNVLEWCSDRADWFDDKRHVVLSPEGSRRVLRGGSWGNSAWPCRSAYRYANDPGDRHRSIGVRLARGQGRAGPAGR